jgi:Domain of unknown function (DUF4190)
MRRLARLPDMESRPMKQDVPPPMFRNVTAVTSLVVGLLGIFSLVVQPAFGFLFGIVAVVLGAIGLRRSHAGVPGRGIAIAGLVLGIFLLVAFAIAAWLVSQDSLVTVP